MDLSKIRSFGREYLLKKTDDLLKKYPNWKYYDQDALNYIFADKCYMMNVNYNYLTAVPYREKYDNPLELKMICHYVEIWLNAQAESPFNHIFWNYFIKTPWFDYRFVMNAFRCSYSLMDRQTDYLRKFWMNFHKREKHILFASRESEKAIKTICPFYEQDQYLDIKDEAGILSVLKNIKNKNDVMIIFVTKDYAKWLVYLINNDFREEVDFFDGRCLFKPSEGGTYLRDTQSLVYKYIMGM